MKTNIPEKYFHGIDQTKKGRLYRQTLINVPMIIFYINIPYYLLKTLIFTIKNSAYQVITSQMLDWHYSSITRPHFSNLKLGCSVAWL